MADGEHAKNGVGKDDCPLLKFLKSFENVDAAEGAGVTKLDGNLVNFLKDKADLSQKVQEWLKWDKNPDTLKVVRQLVQAEKADALEKILGTRLSFGTAGIRGKMESGFNGMNDLVIIQTTQGFVRYLETVFTKEQLTKRGVVIGYDARYHSARWSLLAANAFIQQGYLVYLYSHICPTPWVPFAVTTFKGCAGIMITASHNPKEDNGYKVYWDNGAQIISPHDKGIQKYILANLNPWDGAWKMDAEKLWTEKRIIDPHPIVKTKYLEAIVEGTGLGKDRNKRSKVGFAYTAMHGVGSEFMKQAFEAAGFSPFVSVKEQEKPDPEFPTVKFPNPEEGKSALNLAMQTANENNCSIILANDPDADRLAVAEKLPTGEWKIFNGNEIGALLGWWCLRSWIGDNEIEDIGNCYMISSTVSSKILQHMAKAEGFHFEETLTGFKWMANLADKLMADGKTVLFAFEEAIGFMVGTAVLDKDGLSAGVRMAEMAAEMKERGLTLNDQLLRIYDEYGYHTTCNSYYLCYDPAIIANLFDNIRTLHKDGYPTDIMGGKYKVTRVRDLTTGYDSAEPDGIAKLPSSKGSQMLTFQFDSGLTVTLRTSGTEPKIKYYTEICAPPADKDWNSTKKLLRLMLDAIIEEWIQPTKWGLTVPSDNAGGEEEEREGRCA